MDYQTQSGQSWNYTCIGVDEGINLRMGKAKEAGGMEKEGEV